MNYEYLSDFTIFSTSSSKVDTFYISAEHLPFMNVFNFELDMLSTTPSSVVNNMHFFLQEVIVLQVFNTLIYTSFSVKWYLDF